MEKKPYESCFFTGHREITEDADELKRRLSRFVYGLLLLGVRTFYAGGALGFDTLAAETVLEWKKRREFRSIRLVLVFPCETQVKGWSDEDAARYERIKKEADEVVCLSDNYYKGCMHVRNRYMVDHADVGIAYVRKDEGGTAYTVAYAESAGKKIITL